MRWPEMMMTMVRLICMGCVLVKISTEFTSAFFGQVLFDEMLIRCEAAPAEMRKAVKMSHFYTAGRT
jgi:hypothetical protein